MKYTLLMMNMSYKQDWDNGIVNRNYHLLQTILQQKKFSTVVTCDFIPFSFRTILKTLLIGRPWKKNNTTIYRRWHTRIDRINEQLAHYHIVTLNIRYIVPLLASLRIEPSNTILWSYHPFTSPLFEQPWALTLFDAVDNWSEHPSFQKVKEELDAHYKRIQKHADVITTVSESLIDFFGKQKNVYYVPNGVNADHFNKATCNTTLLPESTTHQHPRIGYHGIIQSRINFTLLQYIAQHRPSWKILLVGPVWKEVQSELNALTQFPNVHYLGAIPYSKLPQFISCFDCALIPHRVDTLTQTMNPLKIYEYLAAGIPIVSTPIPGSEQFQDLVHTTVSPEECIAAIEQQLQHNSSELQQRRKHMATQHSWNARVETMWSIIERYLHHGTSISAT